MLAHSTAAAIVCFLSLGLMAPLAGGAALPPAAQALQERLERQAKAREGELAAQRTAVLRASERRDRILARHAQLNKAADEAARVREVGGIVASIARVWIGEDGSFTRARDQLAARRQQAAAKVDEVTTAAASTQGELLDARRRADAFAAAVAGARRNPELAQAEVSYRFGGEGAAPVSAETIDDYLESKASPMAGQGARFVESGVKWRVDPRFVAAIAGAESYFGLKTCAPHNAWGWGCPNDPFAFDSWAAGFDTVAQGLRENYMDDGLTTVGKIHLRYAPPAAANDPTGLNYAWPDNVARFLVEQGGNPENLEGSGPGGKVVTGISS